ncbi:hypothetical protein MKX03_017403 [Papaver bracteatum]|nr:hypothetical protein MKX03_017403 [Papaver bracteatum]
MKNWVLDVDDLEEDSQKPRWNKTCIYKQHEDSNKKSAAYFPSTVSLGPYHHQKGDHLKKMQPHKHRVLRHFLKTFNITLQTLIDSLVKPSCRWKQVDNVEKEDLPVLQRLMDCYDSLDDEWLRDPDGFLNLMILDGCFMLQILQWSIFYDRSLWLADYAKFTGDGFHYAENDPIFSRRGNLYVIADIRRDMLMLENQLPMLLLKILLGAVLPTQKEEDIESHLNMTILNFCIISEDPIFFRDNQFFLHVIDLYKKCITSPVRSAGTSKKRIERKLDADIISRRSAMNLHHTGIKFTTGYTDMLNDICFRGNILRLPVMVIDDNTESTLLNLMAFERLHVDAGGEVTSYVCFMSNLINSPDDVEILSSNRLLHNFIGSNKAVVKWFKEMKHNITPDPDSRLQNIVQQQLDEHCRIKWRMWRAYLSRTYFTNPWALVSFFSAVLLLALAIFQTLYTIYPYYKPTKGK